MEHSQSYQITHSYATRYNSTHSALTSVAEIIFQRVSICICKALYQPWQILSDRPSDRLVKAKIYYIVSPQLPYSNCKSVTSPSQVGAGKSPLRLLCRVVSQIPLQRLVADLLAVSLTSPQQVLNKSATSTSAGNLRRNVYNGVGHNAAGWSTDNDKDCNKTWVTRVT